MVKVAPFVLLLVIQIHACPTRDSVYTTRKHNVGIQHLDSKPKTHSVQTTAKQISSSAKLQVCSKDSQRHKNRLHLPRVPKNPNCNSNDKTHLQYPESRHRHATEQNRSLKKKPTKCNCYGSQSWLHSEYTQDHGTGRKMTTNAKSTNTGENKKIPLAFSKHQRRRGTEQTIPTKKKRSKRSCCGSVQLICSECTQGNIPRVTLSHRTKSYNHAKRKETIQQHSKHDQGPNEQPGKKSAKSNCCDSISLIYANYSQGQGHSTGKKLSLNSNPNGITGNKKASLQHPKHKRHVIAQNLPLQLKQPKCSCCGSISLTYTEYSQGQLSGIKWSLKQKSVKTDEKGETKSQKKSDKKYGNWHNMPFGGKSPNCDCCGPMKLIYFEYTPGPGAETKSPTKVKSTKRNRKNTIQSQQPKNHYKQSNGLNQQLWPNSSRHSSYKAIALPYPIYCRDFLGTNGVRLPSTLYGMPSLNTEYLKYHRLGLKLPLHPKIFNYFPHRAIPMLHTVYSHRKSERTNFLDVPLSSGRVTYEEIPQLCPEYYQCRGTEYVMPHWQKISRSSTTEPMPFLLQQDSQGFENRHRVPFSSVPSDYSCHDTAISQYSQYCRCDSVPSNILQPYSLINENYGKSPRQLEISNCKWPLQSVLSCCRGYKDIASQPPSYLL